MDEIKKVVRKRKPRTIAPEKQIAAIDKKIEKIKAESARKIEELEAQKDAIMKPIKAKKALEEAMKNMSPEEIAEKLGINLD